MSILEHTTYLPLRSVVYDPLQPLPYEELVIETYRSFSYDNRSISPPPTSLFAARNNHHINNRSLSRPPAAGWVPSALEGGNVGWNALAPRSDSVYAGAGNTVPRDERSRSHVEDSIGHPASHRSDISIDLNDLFPRTSHSQLDEQKLDEFENTDESGTYTNASWHEPSWHDATWHDDNEKYGKTYVPGSAMDYKIRS